MILDLLEAGDTADDPGVQASATAPSSTTTTNSSPSREASNFTYVPALSDEPADSGWEGFRGYVHEAATAHFDNDFRGHKAYLWARR